MRKLVIILSLLVSSVQLLANKYVNNTSGNDGNPGTLASPYKSITKLNTAIASMAPGDSILFNRGDVFIGSLVMSRSGTAGARIVIAAYGTGARPIISGFTTLSGWSSLGGSLWDITPGVTIKANCNVFTINGYPQAVGRTPNTGSYLVYQTANTTTNSVTGTMTSTSIAASPSLVGAELVFKNNSYSASKAKITGHSGTVLTYGVTQAIDNNNPVGSNPVMPTGGNYPFFLQRLASSLDVQGEWYFDPITNKMRIFSTVNPSTLTIKASFIDTLFILGTRTDITIDGISFEGAGMYAIETYGASNITIKNCDFINNTRAIYGWGIVNPLIDSCNFKHSFNNAVLFGQSSNRANKQVTFTHNVVDSTGQLIGMGLYWSNNNLKGVVIKTDTSTLSNFVNMSDNIIINSGYSGMEHQGSNVTIRRNIVDSFCSKLQDGGGIYTFVSNASLNNLHYVNINIDSNFIGNAIGAAWGVGADLGLDVVGGYDDDQARNNSWKNNLIYNIPGPALQMNTPHDNQFIGNTVYNCQYFMALNKRHVAEVYNNVIKKNIMYQKLSTQLNFFHVDDNLTLPTSHTITQGLQNIAVIDSNWISNTNTTGFKYYYSANGVAYTFPPNFNLATWQGTYFHEGAVILPPIAVTNTNTTLWKNPSYTTKVVPFQGFRKIDPKGVIYDNQATVGRWSSLILIDNGNSPVTGNIAPVARIVTMPSPPNITLPTNGVILTGTSSTDADGSISVYLWTKISGPATGSFNTPNANTTNFGALTAGTYVVQLTVTDNGGATNSTTVQVVVSPAPINQPPVVTASANPTTITLPVNSVALLGSATDDGTISTHVWDKLSGPAIGTIASTSSYTTTAINLVEGVYQFRLTATDNNAVSSSAIVVVTVNPAIIIPNQPPTVTASVDQIITQPTSSVTISASANDPDGNITSYVWTKISGPAVGTITTPNVFSTTITGLTLVGTYNYKITVTDNGTPGLTAQDNVTIRVDSLVVPVNQSPIANAGPNRNITLPINTTTLDGSASNDPDGTISNYLWSKISGPVTGTIVTANVATTTFNNLVQGTYHMRLVVTDNLGAKDTAFMFVVVNAAPINQKPTIIFITADHSITLPTNSTSVTITGADADGSIAAYKWIQVAGPNTATIVAATSQTTAINGLIAGVYTFQGRVFDNHSPTDSAVANVKVTVNPAVNVRPIARASNDTTITLPSNSVPLTSILSSDPDGSITSRTWLQISGPSTATNSTPNGVTTTIGSLIQGVYVIKLTVVGSSGASDTSSTVVNITVNPAPILIPPIADAGIDQTLTSPTSSTTLTGIGTDLDGTISSYAWVQLSGPNTATGTPSSSVSQAISGLIVGTYKFKLTVTDNDGLVGRDTVQIDVVSPPANKPPVANAGEDIITINLSVVLNGGGNDLDGSIVSYLWEKVEGPAGDLIVTPNAASTTISNLQLGLYRYKLTVTDNGTPGLTNSDEMVLVVSRTMDDGVYFYQVTFP